MNPTDRNKVTQTTIHKPAQVVSFNIIPHQGYSGTNQGKMKMANAMRGKKPKGVDLVINGQSEIRSVAL